MAAEKSISKETRQMVRLIDSDIPGQKTIFMAVQFVKGISFSMAAAICTLLKLERTKRIGDMTEEEIKKVEDVIKNPLNYGIPGWMINRRKDYETGNDVHLITADLKYSMEEDIKRLKKIKAYRGIRHSMGQPTRGQRTKGHFRHGLSVGVKSTKKSTGK